MSEERRQVHPQDPAEGAEENVETPGAEKPGQDRGTAEEAGSGQNPAQHPQQPAEGGEDEVEAPGAEGPDNAG